MHYRVGTRGSKLALRQTQIVIEALQAANPEDTYEVVVIHTKGDRMQNRPLEAIGGKGIFVEEIEKELLEDTIQMAVHSMKDMPEALPEGLVYARPLKREDARDVLITRSGCRFEELPQGAVLATGSKRRMAQIQEIRPDIKVTGIRGNVDTRLRKLREGYSDTEAIDGIVIAAAGMHRLGLDAEITQYLDPRVFIPSPAQGILGIELRADHTELLAKLNALADPETDHAVQAERGFLMEVGGNCHLPVGAWYTEQADGSRELHTFCGTEGDSRVARAVVRREQQDEQEIVSMVEEAIRRTKQQLGD